MLQDKRQDVTTAILGRLREIRAGTDKPVVIYEIGVPLIAAGYDQHEIANGGYRLQRDSAIELMMSTALKVFNPM